MIWAAATMRHRRWAMRSGTLMVLRETSIPCSLTRFHKAEWVVTGDGKVGIVDQSFVTQELSGNGSFDL
jgi:hypothetical protein